MIYQEFIHKWPLPIAFLQNNGSRNLTGFSAARLPFYFGEVQRVGEPNREQDFSSIRNKTAIAGIGVSVLSGTKQIVSGLSLFADPEVNTIEILAYAKRGIANSTKFARTSETIKQRGAAFNKDVSQFLTEQKKQVKTQESVSNLKDPASLPLLIFTRIGDRLGAIPSASIKFEILKDRFFITRVYRRSCNSKKQIEVLQHS